jgi:saccharopine dehydrogenase-like NADP-dependent oxidoreductase
MAQIVLFGAGKSATTLIRYLIGVAAPRGWTVVVADSNFSLASSKIGKAACAQAVQVKVEEEEELDKLVSAGDVIISLLPPALHFLVAQSCLRKRKHLLTASYVDDAIRRLQPAIAGSGLLFLCEMGLDPGIDHMSALQLIGEVRETADRVISFHSHTGGLVAPESDDNPWHYKISWNPRNVVRAGAAGARFRQDGREVVRDYPELFEEPGRVRVDGAGDLAWYPNRDSMPYIDLYGLGEVQTFVRTTLRYPSFCSGWSPIVRAGLTDDVKPLSNSMNGRPGGNTDLTMAEWAAPLLPYVRPDNREMYAFLGLFDRKPVPEGAKTSADVLQHLLETRLAMRPDDRDMIVMQHEIGYVVGATPKWRRSTLVVKGEDSLHTAMARTVGTPLGIAAKLLLEGVLRSTGLQIPVLPEIYAPVMKELEKEGISFTEEMG